MRIATGIFLIFLSAGCGSVDLRSPPRGTRQDTARATVPFEWRGNSPVVQVVVGAAGTRRFLLDTGTAHTIVSHECARLAGLKEVRKEGMSGGSAGSVTREIVMTRIPRLGLGRTTFIGVAAVVDDLSAFGIDGILGFRAFHDVVLTIDGPRREVRLTKDRLPDPATDAHCLPLVLKDPPVPHVRGRIAGHPATILIDSGYAGSLLLARNIPGDLGLAFEDEGTVRIRTRLSTHEARRGRLRERVEIGTLVLENLPTIVAMGGPVILGGGFLRERVVSFDQRNQLIRIAPRP